MIKSRRGAAARAAVALLVLLIAAIATPTSSSAVSPGKPGAVLFAQWDDSLQDWFLFTMAPGGQPVIVPGTNHAAGGRWSPDGKVITYTIWNEGIYIINPDGSGKRLLFEPGEGERVGMGIWSPDGTRLAFAIESQDSPLGRIEIANSLTGDRQQVDTGLSNVWDWPREGFLLGTAYRPGGPTPNSNPEIASYSFADGHTTMLTNSADQEGVPRLSPDGSKILYVAWSADVAGGYAIGVMNADGSNQQLIRPTGGQVTWPAWSPDGEAIVFGPIVKAMTIDGLHTWPLGDSGYAEDGFDWAPLAGTTEQFQIEGVRALALPDPSTVATASASTSTIRPSVSSNPGSSTLTTATASSVTITQQVHEPAKVTLKIYKPSGVLMKTVNYGLMTGRLVYNWNGRLPTGKLAPAGSYKFVAKAVDLAGNIKKKTLYVKVVR